MAGRKPSAESITRTTTNGSAHDPSHQDALAALKSRPQETGSGSALTAVGAVGRGASLPVMFSADWALVSYSAGDFVDDYAIDPFERNDQSFIFLLETQGGVPSALRLHPTTIVDFQARVARGNARPIARRMQELCTELGTRSTWLEDENCLAIPLHE